MKNFTLLILSVFLGFSIHASAEESSASFTIKGKLSLSNYYFTDSSTPNKFNITSLRLRFDANRKDNNLNLHFKVKERIKSSNSDVSNKNRQHNISLLNFEYTAFSGNNHITLGRQNTIITDLDGMDIKHHLSKRSSAGIFFGLKPDPYLQSFNSDYSTIGAYHTYNSMSFNSNLAIVNDGYKGGSDRSYIFLQSNYIPVKTIRLSNTFIADTIGITSINMSGNIRLSKKARLSLYYSQFKAIKLKRSMDYTIDSRVQRRIYIKIKYQILESFRLYSKFQFRQRETDGKNAKEISIGTNWRLPYWENTYLNARYTKNYKFTTDSDSLSGEISTYIFKRLNLTFSIEGQKNLSKLKNTTQNVVFYSTAANYKLSRSIYFNLSYDYVSSNEFATHTIFSMIALRF